MNPGPGPAQAVIDNSINWPFALEWFFSLATIGCLVAGVWIGVCLWLDYKNGGSNETPRI